MPIQIDLPAGDRGTRAARRRAEAATAACTWPEDVELGAAARALRTQRVLLALVGALLLALWGPLAARTLGDCWHDENYSHGVLVPLVVLALLQQRRHDLVRFATRGVLRMRALAWLMLSGGALGFVFGSAASEDFTLRASGVCVALGLTGVLGGPARLRRYGPPLALLFTCIPLPYVFFYKLSFPLQLLSAKLAAGALDLGGLDVARNGNVFVVNGHALEVVGACSGIRSMMALCALALVVAVASRLGTLRGGALAVAALPVAMCGNLLRLLVTALLVAWLGPRAAEGTLHEAVGLASFLAAAALLWMLVGWMRRSRPTVEAPRSSDAPGAWRRLPRPSRIAAWLRTLRVVSARAGWIAFGTLVLAGGYGLLLQTRAVEPDRAAELATVPLQFGAFAGADVPLDDRVLDKLRPEDHLFRSYSDGASTVGLYVAYYRNPSQGAQIHSPMHCYPGAGWKVLRSEPLQVRDLRGTPTRMQRLVVGKGRRSDVVVYWYDTRAGRMTGDLALKLNLMRAALVHAPQDAAFVRWSTPMQEGEDLEGATVRLLSVVARAYPDLESALPFGG